MRWQYHWTNGLRLDSKGRLAQDSENEEEPGSNFLHMFCFHVLDWVSFLSSHKEGLWVRDITDNNKNLLIPCFSFN